MKGLILWWSTFYQRWNWTPWEGTDYSGKGDTRRFGGKPILSEGRMITVLCSEMCRIYPDSNTHNVRLVESAYSAIVCDDEKQMDYLQSRVEWLVCHEV